MGVSGTARPGWSSVAGTAAGVSRDTSAVLRCVIVAVSVQTALGVLVFQL